MVERQGSWRDDQRRGIGWGRALVAGGLGILLGLGGCALIVGRVADGLGDFSGLDHAFDCIGEHFARHPFTPVLEAPDGRPPTWTTELDAPPTSAPVVADDLVVVRTTTGGVTALDATTGAVRWNIPLGAASPLGTDFAPVVDGDTVFLTDWDGIVHALDTTTGANHWATKLPTDPAPTTTTLTVPDGTDAISDAFGRAPRGGAPLAVDAGSVYVDADDLVAMDRATGAVRWSAPLDNLALDAYSQPVVTGDEVVVGTSEHAAHHRRAVAAFDLATGTRRWTAIGDGGAGAFAAPRVVATTAGIVVTGLRTHRVAVLDAATGEQVRLVHGGPFAAFGSVPTSMGAFLLIRGTGVWALDPATGSEIWDADIDGSNVYDFGPAAVTEDLVITPGTDGRLHALDRAHGTETWAIGSPVRHKCGSTVAVPPAVTDTSLIVLSGDRAVTALPR